MVREELQHTVMMPGRVGNPEPFPSYCHRCAHWYMEPSGAEMAKRMRLYETTDTPVKVRIHPECMTCQENPQGVPTRFYKERTGKYRSFKSINIARTMCVGLLVTALAVVVVLAMIGLLTLLWHGSK